jgi:curved DNA-binding protein CbpA
VSATFTLGAMHSDHYQALGIHPQASHAEVRAAYLRLMRAHHPDRRPDDAAAADVARRANAAWEVLGDAARRASYDRLRAGGRLEVRFMRVSPTAQARAYSPDRTHYRRAFHLACLRVAGAVFALGLLLLLAVR